MKLSCWSLVQRVWHHGVGKAEKRAIERSRQFQLPYRIPIHRSLRSGAVHRMI